jgi:hypothetical protein
MMLSQPFAANMSILTGRYSVCWVMFEKKGACPTGFYFSSEKSFAGEDPKLTGEDAVRHLCKDGDTTSAESEGDCR